MACKLMLFSLLLAKNNFAENLSLYLLQSVLILAKALTIAESSLFYIREHLYATPSKRFPYNLENTFLIYLMELTLFLVVLPLTIHLWSSISSYTLF